LLFLLLLEGLTIVHAFFFVSATSLKFPPCFHCAEGMTPQERMDNYGCDITYVTNSELGFDFLRDNLATVSSTSYAANISALAWSVLRDGKTLPSSTISGILLASAGCKLILNCCISCQE
jgi:hypothetical protein